VHIYNVKYVDIPVYANPLTTNSNFTINLSEGYYGIRIIESGKLPSEELYFSVVTGTA